MARNVRIRQLKQVRESETYDDARTNGPGMETGEEHLENDLNNLRSQLRRIIDATGNWFDDPITDLVSLIALVNREYRQSLLGPINGTNTIFATSTKFIRDGTRNEVLKYNGVTLDQGGSDDYVASESVPTTGFDTVTLTFAPQVGDKLIIDFTPKV